MTSHHHAHHISELHHQPLAEEDPPKVPGERKILSSVHKIGHPTASVSLTKTSPEKMIKIPYQLASPMSVVITKNVQPLNNLSQCQVETNCNTGESSKTKTHDENLTNMNEDDKICQKKETATVPYDEPKLDPDQKYKRLAHDFERLKVDRESCLEQLKIQTQVHCIHTMSILLMFQLSHKFLPFSDQRWT